MKKILGVLLTSTLLTTSAFSNAGPAAPCPACPEVPVTKWGGFKLGGQFGYSHVLASANGFTGGAKGFVGGAHLGYDFQLNKNWILGATTSFDFSDVDNQKYTVAVVPRVGYVMQDSLFYVGAGWAGSKFSDFENAFRLSVGAGQKMNKVLLGAEVNYDVYGHNNLRALSGMLKVSFCM